MKCLNCGKEIPESRKFCSRSCAASYNNVRRERKPWTEEQHLKNRKPRREVVCKYCGKPGKLICDECKPFVQRIHTFERLNLQGKNLREKNQNLLEKLKTLYFEEKLSLAEIWEKTGLRYRQIELYFHSAGISLRSVSESQKNALLVGRKAPVSSPRMLRGYHITWEGIKIWYRSSYELKFAEELDKKKVRYRVESERIKYWDSELQRYRVAVPDFYLPDTRELVEVKSSYTLCSIQRMQDKFLAYKAAGFIPKLWLNLEFVELEKIKKGSGELANQEP